MDPLDQKLREIAAGRILDIAAGRGGSLKHILDTVGSWDSAVGVDISGKNIAEAREKISDRRVTFDTMSADKLSFPDNSFDMVTNINSLHHLEHAPAALNEMLRVLKPGGTFLLCDMYSDTDNELQLTHVYIHHLWAEVNRMEGIPHFDTYSRDRLAAMMRSLNLSEVELIDKVDTSPIEDTETLHFLTATCDEYAEKLKDKPEHRDIVDRFVQLKERISTVGIAWASQLCALGRK